MRDLFLKKVLFAALWLPLFLFACYWGGWALLGPVIVVALVGMGEYYSATFKKGHRPAVKLGYLTGVLILIVTQFAPDKLREGSLLGLIIIMVGCALMMQFSNRADQSAVDNSAVTAFGVIYVPLMLSFMLRLRQFDLPSALNYDSAPEFWHRAGALMLVLAPVWLCDTVASAVGGAWGRHKLAPAVSPNKTIEGALGGWIAAVLSAVGLGLLVGMPWYHGAILGAFLGVVGQLGDLGKSTLKRDLHIKDFGSLFGPHGGVLDRFDAAMFALPLGYLYVWLFFYHH